MKVILLIAVLWAPSLPAAAPLPTIDSILNGASYALRGLPNSSIAQGSIFVVSGTDIGPAEAVRAQDLPLPPMLGGSSVRVAVGDTEVDAVMLYASSTRLEAILPSQTPTGIGLLTVTYQGRTSQAGAFRIVQSSPGIVTQTQDGKGRAVAENFNSQMDQPPNGFTRAAHPGQVVTLHGTGLGPIAGDDGTQPVHEDLNANLQVLVGGVPAVVRYHGRSLCCPGADEVAFEVPRGVEGCYVPVALLVDSVISNFATISVASGDLCTDLNGATGADIEKLLGGGELAFGAIGLRLGLGWDCEDYPCDLYSETADGAFSRSSTIVSDQLSTGLPSPGSCLVSTAGSAITFGLFGSVSTVPLDAGAALNLSGPNGTLLLPMISSGFYAGQFSTNATQIQYLKPGKYEVDNGPGGTDIGPFRVALTIPQPFTSTIARSPSAISVTWSGGDPTGFVVIRGSGTSATTGAIASFVCTERVAAGRFTVPQAVFLSLPTILADESGPSVNVTSTAAATFKARGLDVGRFFYTSSIQ